jgi:hypothetical protein
VGGSMTRRTDLGTRVRRASAIRRSVVSVALCSLVFTACADAGSGTRPQDRDGDGGPPKTSSSPVSLWLSSDRVPPRPAELVAVLVNRGTRNVVFGVNATVDRWDGDGWTPAGEIVMCMDDWHCTARIERPGASGAIPAIGLAPRPGGSGPIERFTTGGLGVGWYRISQVANEGVVASAVFEVANDAPAPSPLVPVDQPNISISPALVSPAGGSVVLYPLIPAPSGSQSREDIESAIAGLSETARIERWTGTWEGVAVVKLNADADEFGRSAGLPPLSPGHYRLVREGPGMDHVGDFWISAAAPTAA